MGKESAKDEEKDLRDRIRRLEKKMRKKKKRKHHRNRYDYSSPCSSSEHSNEASDKENESERERRSCSHASRRRRVSRSRPRRRSRSRDSFCSRSCIRSSSQSNETIQTQAENTSSTENHNLNQESTKKPTNDASGQAIRSVREDVTLGEDMLLVIGKRLRSDKKLTEPVHKDIQIRWEEIYKDGLPKDIKAELLSKHPQPANVAFLKAPKLNLELKASVHESVTNRDNRLVEKQEKVAVCLSVLGSILSRLLNKEEVKSIELIEKISDSCRILVDLQRDEALTRRSLIMSNIQASLKETLKTAEVDEFLFGKQLEEQVKAAKLIEKSTSRHVDTQQQYHARTTFY